MPMVRLVSNKFILIYASEFNLQSVYSVSGSPLSPNGCLMALLILYRYL